MEIKFETKLNVGDKIFFMKENRPTCYEVCNIKIEIMSIGKDCLIPRINISYNTTPCLNNVPENLAFKTKEELINSL